VTIQLTMTVEDKADQLVELLRSYGRVAIAFSGGVDSAVVAKAAVLGCGDKAVAVTADSPSLASGELEQAAAVCKSIGILHRVIKTDEFERTGYQQNAGDRCYYCKSELYERIVDLLPSLDIDVICNGANLDDQGDHRPGMKAAAEQHVRSPLLELKFNKSDVRALAKFWGLEVWDKPAMPCLSSRVAYGVEVTPDKVRMVDCAETYLREQFNLREFRVRLEANSLARIEVPTEAIPVLIEPNNRTAIISKFKEFGFKYVTIDLEGFRSGSMNQALDFVDLVVPAGILKEE
jgi:pyridinium-3,5-biscarboxylic acid mononucleotide sulfurtransferase